MKEKKMFTLLLLESSFHVQIYTYIHIVLVYTYLVYNKSIQTLFFQTVFSFYSLTISRNIFFFFFFFFFFLPVLQIIKNQIYFFDSFNSFFKLLLTFPHTHIFDSLYQHSPNYSTPYSSHQCFFTQTYILNKNNTSNH